MKHKVIMFVLFSILKLNFSNAGEAGSVELSCPKGSFVKGVVAHGAKAMSLTSGGLNNGFGHQSGQCVASHGWTIAMSDISLSCFDPVSQKTINAESNETSSKEERKVDVELFEDHSWFGNTTEARLATKRDLSVECTAGEMVEFNSNVSTMDPFCQGTVEVATKPFRCVRFSSETPTTGFKILKSIDSSLFLFQLNHDLLSSKGLIVKESEYFSYALPISNHQLTLSSPDTEVTDQSLQRIAEELKIPVEKLSLTQTRKIMALYVNLCNENRAGKGKFALRDRMSSLREIPGRRCWYPDDQVAQSKLNYLTREIEAILEVGFGQDFVKVIDEDMSTPAWNMVTLVDAMFDKLGTNGGTAEQFAEAVAYYNSKEFSDKVQIILEQRKYSYLEWAFRLKLYERYGQKPNVNYDLNKIILFSKVKMISSIMNDPTIKMDISPNIQSLLKDLNLIEGAEHKH